MPGNTRRDKEGRAGGILHFLFSTWRCNVFPIWSTDPHISFVSLCRYSLQRCSASAKDNKEPSFPSCFASLGHGFGAVSQNCVRMASAFVFLRGGLVFPGSNMSSSRVMAMITVTISGGILYSMLEYV